MERILTYHISPEHEGLRVAQYLKRQGYSHQNIASIKQMPDSILVNGTPLYMNQRVHAGDLLEVHITETRISEKILPVNIPLDIIYEDEDLIVINKPSGMPIHPSMNNYDNTMANGLAYYYKMQGKPFIFRCCNRLDRDTSGLTVVAKHLVCAGRLSDMTLKRQIHREYLGLATGHVTPEKGTITAPLARKSGSIIQRVVDFEKGEEAITYYEVISYTKHLSLCQLKLETGRTHQIRVHMQYLGYPLVGDYLYNPDMTYINRQALHSYRLSLAQPITGRWLSFTAPLPADMQQALLLSSN